MARVAITRLIKTLDLISQKQDRGENCKEEVVVALLDAWTIVDICHRVRELIQQAPGLSAKSPQIQIFLRSTSDFEKLRDYVQHLYNGIPRLPEKSYPLWGSLSWFPTDNALKCYTIVSGHLSSNIEAPTCSLDIRSQAPTQRIVLFAGTASADLSSIGDKLDKLKEFVKNWIDNQPNFKRVEGCPLIFSFEFIKDQISQY